MREIGANPARLIPAWREFVDAHAASGRRVRGIGEPIWAGRSEAELVECQRHEALLNLAFADAGPLSLLCPYDTASLDDDVIARGAAQPPRGRARRPSQPQPRYCGRRGGGGPFAEPLPEPRGPVAECTFARATSRRCGNSSAARARGGPRRGPGDDLVLAVNEVASNSVRHGGGRDVGIWRERGTLDLRGARRRAPRGPPRRSPAPGPAEIGGHGLWIANQVCDLVQLRSFPEGTAVRIHMHAS